MSAGWLNPDQLAELHAVAVRLALLGEAGDDLIAVTSIYRLYDGRAAARASWGTRYRDFHATHVPGDLLQLMFGAGPVGTTWRVRYTGRVYVAAAEPIRRGVAWLRTSDPPPRPGPDRERRHER